MTLLTYQKKCPKPKKQQWQKLQAMHLPQAHTWHCRECNQSFGVQITQVTSALLMSVGILHLKSPQAKLDLLAFNALATSSLNPGDWHGDNTDNFKTSLPCHTKSDKKKKKDISNKLKNIYTNHTPVWGKVGGRLMPSRLSLHLHAEFGCKKPSSPAPWSATHLCPRDLLRTGTATCWCLFRSGSGHIPPNPGICFLKPCGSPILYHHSSQKLPETHQVLLEWLLVS